MAIQRLSLLSLCCLLATALGASRQLQLQLQQAPGSSPDGNNTYCYKTVTTAPKVCGVEFIEVFLSGGDKKFIGDICCEYLVCVHEASCVEELRKMCSPEAMGSKCEGFYPLPPPPPVVADVATDGMAN